MKNNTRGFTLTELIAVITILSILIALVLPNLFKAFNKSKDRQFEILVETFKKATDLYLSDNKEKYPELSNSKSLIADIKYNNDCKLDEVSLKTLLDAKLLKYTNSSTKELTDPRTDEAIDLNNTKISIYLSGKNQFRFEYNDQSNVGYSCYYKQKENTTINNYVWFNGNLWRMYGVTSGNEIKLISDENISISSFGQDSDINYTTSFIKDFLDNKYLPYLNNKALMTSSDVCIDTRTDKNSVSLKCNNKVTTNVSLLTLDEYNIVSNGLSSSYLNNDQDYWLVTPFDLNKIYTVNASGIKDGKQTNIYTYGIKPVITVKSDVTYIVGTGTKEDPYILNEGNYANPTTTRIQERFTGEYVSINDKIYRIMYKTADGNIKIILNKPYEEVTNVSKTFTYGSTNYLTTASGLGQYLNNTVLNNLFPNQYRNMVVNTKYYQGKYDSNQGVMDSLIEYTDEQLQGVDKAPFYMVANIGLPRVGDLYTGNTVNSTFKNIWTMSSGPEYNKAYQIINGGNISNSLITDSVLIKPIVTIKGTTVINSGNGTLKSPYILK